MPKRNSARSDTAGAPSRLDLSYLIGWFKVQNKTDHRQAKQLAIEYQQEHQMAEINPAWSYSRLTSFETCAKKFWHVSVQKDVKEPESDAMRYGNKVHKALEKRVGSGTKLPSELSFLEPIAAKFANAPGTKMVEQQLAITQDFKPTTWFAKDVWCRAIIDLALINNTKALIVDWKTGKESNDYTQLQLAASMFFIFNPEVEEADIMFYWIKSRKPAVKNLKRVDVKHIWTPLVKRVRRYTQAHIDMNFPPKPSGLCKKHCPVTGCPHHGVG